MNPQPPAFAHDDTWLTDEPPSYATGDIAAEIDYRQYAMDYHEHMNRWRPITETPEVGQWVLWRTPRAYTEFRAELFTTEIMNLITHEQHRYEGWFWKPIDFPEGV